MTESKELQNWWKEGYPQWKKVLWRAVRAFVATFIPTFMTLIATVDAQDLGDEEKRASLFVSIFVSSLAAGITAVGKILRDKFEEEGWLQKMPI